ncbi:protein nutcracker [Drosophila innubila]|uniref:protein nutcracker n=1 Tax=Drosophila innubila TaxID=198719 RepID=UPI00148CC4D4|nr:protein nutcracker [Drosophila innubila]
MPHTHTDAFPTKKHTHNIDATTTTNPTTSTRSCTWCTHTKPCLITAATDVKGQQEEEPLCLEYATPDAVPLHLRQMLGQHTETKISSVELLMLLIYLVALESGFVEDNTYVEKRDQLRPVPAVGCFHIYNVRLLSQQSPQTIRKSEDAPFRMVLRTLLDESATQEDSNVSTLQSHLMAVVLGDLLMVTLSPAPPSKEPGHSICLSIGRFVLNVQLEPLYKRFRRLDELSLQLRQKLFQPMRAQQLLALKFYLHPSLLGLPDELYNEIFRYLNVNQLNIVANVNRQLCNYRKLFKRHD